MAIINDSMTIYTDKTGPVSSKGPRESEWERRKEALRVREQSVAIRFENLAKEGYRSQKSLRKFNLSIERLEFATSTLEKDLKSVHSKIFGSGRIDPAMKRGIDKYKSIGASIGELVKVHSDIDKSLNKLSGSRAYSTLAGAIGRGREIIPAGGRFGHIQLPSDIASAFRGMLKSAESSLRGFGVSNLARGVGTAGSMPTFRMVGKSVTEALDTKLLRDQLRDERSFGQQAGMYAQRGPGVYEAEFERLSPSPSFGKKTSYFKKYLPARIGGGYGSGGPPIFTGGGLPAISGGPVGPVIYGPPLTTIPQTSFASRIPNSGWPQTGGGGWGVGKMLGVGAAGLGLAYETGKAAQSVWREMNDAGAEAYRYQKAHVNAAMTMGLSPSQASRAFGINPNRPSDFPESLRKYGIFTWEQLDKITEGYGRGYRAPAIARFAMQTSYNKRMNFKTQDEWGKFYGKVADTGIYAGSSLDRVMTGISADVRNKERFGFSGQQVGTNWETALGAMSDLGIMGGAGELNRMATFGATSAIPSMRNLTDQMSAMSTNQGQLFDATSNPLLVNSFIFALRKYTGSISLAPQNVNKMLKKMGLPAIPREQYGMFEAAKNMPQLGPKLFSIAGMDTNVLTNAIMNTSLGAATRGNRGATQLWRAVTSPSISTARVGLESLGGLPGAPVIDPTTGTSAFKITLPKWEVSTSLIPGLGRFSPTLRGVGKGKFRYEDTIIPSEDFSGIAPGLRRGDTGGGELNVARANLEEGARMDMNIAISDAALQTFSKWLPPINEGLEHLAGILEDMGMLVGGGSALRSAESRAVHAAVSSSHPPSTKPGRP